MFLRSVCPLNVYIDICFLHQKIHYMTTHLGMCFMKIIRNPWLQQFLPLDLHQSHHQILVPEDQFQFMRKHSWNSWAQNISFKKMRFWTRGIETLGMWITGLWTLALQIQTVKLLCLRTQCEAHLPYLHQGKPLTSWSFSVATEREKKEAFVYVLSKLSLFLFWLSSRTLERGHSVNEDQASGKKVKPINNKKQKGPPKSKWNKSSLMLLWSVFSCIVFE